MRHHPLLVANWKMYPSLSDAVVLAHGVKKALHEMEHLEVVLCPPAIMLPIVHDIIANHKLSRLHIGAQNIHQLEQGPYTGEISASMAKSFAQYVIVGHSERVKWFNETPEDSNRKIKSALKQGLTPIICVGENQKSDKAGQEILKKLGQILAGVPSSVYDELVVAYEPVWAISKGDPKSQDAASGEYAQEIAQQIRQKVGLHARILYGGSTNSENIGDFLHQDDIDGVLVGATSMDLQGFIKMCEIASEMR